MSYHGTVGDLDRSAQERGRDVPERGPNMLERLDKLEAIVNEQRLMLDEQNLRIARLVRVVGCEMQEVGTR